MIKRNCGSDLKQKLPAPASWDNGIKTCFCFLLFISHHFITLDQVQRGFIFDKLFMIFIF